MYVLVDAGPAEVDARIRLAIGPQVGRQGEHQDSGIRAVVIDEASYSAKVQGQAPSTSPSRSSSCCASSPRHPSRVFTREQLLSEVWGYDYFGGTRTVDVHVRRLRAKLGDLESLIGTVRNVGYRFTGHEDDADGA
jgi:DNA-binding response OmpR family regulator